MSFGTNMQYLRKQQGMTQEELAEAMGVSRQTISKWESDTSYPEMEKLMQICGLFSCSMDTLMRGSLEANNRCDTADYDKEMNRFTMSICTGTAIVLAGVTLLLFLIGVLGAADAVGTTIFLIFVVVAAMFFIVGGISHGNYTQRHPYIQPFYSQEEIDRFDRKFPVLIAAPIALVLIGVVLVVAAEALPYPANFSLDRWEALFVSLLLLCVTIAAPILIYAGMQKSKYDIEAYNKECSPDEETKRKNETIGKWSACIMMVATIAYLLMGFLGDLWHIGWVVYPAGGILCGIVSVIVKGTQDQ